MSAVSTPTPTTRAMRRTIAWGPFTPAGAAANFAQPFVLDRADLLAHDAQPRQMAAQLRARVLQQRRPFRCAQTVELFRCFAQGRPESANAKAGKDGLDLVHDPRLVSDQVPPLAVRPLCVLLFGRRDRRHAAMALLAAQPAEKGAHQQFRVEAIGLRPPMFARHRDARGVDHVSLDIAGLQPARQPEAIASRLVSDDDALDLTPGLASFVAPTMQELP